MPSTEPIYRLISVRDLRIMVNESLTPSSHIANITATAHQRVNLIFRTFVSRDVTMLLRAYTTDVRPLLEYNTAAVIFQYFKPF